MTSSYHEINDDDEAGDGELELSLPGAKKLFNRAKNWVGDLSLEGVVTQEGQQVTYVTQDLAEKIKLSSPNIKYEGDTAEEKDYPHSHDPSDLNSVINEMETEAKKLATSLDQVTENLTGILHSVNKYLVFCICERIHLSMKCVKIFSLFFLFYIVIINDIRLYIYG